MGTIRRNRRPSLDAAQRCTHLSPLFVVTFVALSHGTAWVYFTFTLSCISDSAIDPDRVILNLRLVQLLYVVVAVWLVLLSRQLITSNSGHGLVLAIFGLHARLLSEFARDGTEFIRDRTVDSVYPPDVPAMFHDMAGTAYETQVELVGGLGVTTFMIGLVSVAVAVIIELRARSSRGGPMQVRRRAPQAL